MAAASKNVLKPRVLAAALVADDELSNAEIADRAGVDTRTLTRWKQDPTFNALVGDHVGQLQAGMLRLAIAKKRKRLEVLDNLHSKLLTVVEERAAEYAAMAKEDAAAPTITPIRSMIGDKTVPAGGGTGLIVRQIKQIGTGHTAQMVEEFGVDTGLIKSIQSLEEQAAKELGQWVEKTEASGTIRREYVVVRDDASVRSHLGID